MIGASESKECWAEVVWTIIKIGRSCKGGLEESVSAELGALDGLAKCLSHQQ